jgi:hypothetical protein
MPIKVYNPYESTWDTPAYDDVTACILNDGFKLRKHLANGLFSFTGRYVESVFTFPTFAALRFGKAIGLDFAGEVPDGSSVEFRISTDGGVNYLVYDTGTFSWRTANPDEFVPIDDLNSGMSTLSLAPEKTFTIQMKLIPNIEKVLTPLIYCVVFYFELEEYIPYQDVMRSVKRYIENNLTSKLRYALKTITTGNVVQLDVNLNVKEIKSVYDLTTDAAKVYNLFDSYDDLTKTVTLNNNIAAGNIIEINYRGCPEVLICQDPDYEESDLPRILVDVIDAKENNYGPFYLHTNENYSSSENVRVRQVPIQKDYRVLVEALCPSGLDSYAYAHAIDKIFRGIAKIDAIESGSLISCVQFQPFQRFDIVENNLKVKRTSFTAVLDDYFDKVEEQKKIQDIVITYGLTRKF